MEQKQNRSSFSGKLGFVLSAAGASVGLGNIWRFPYLAAKYGGGIFLLIYIVLALTFGYTMIMAETALGRMTHKSPVSAYGAFAKSGRKNGFLGFGGWYNRSASRAFVWISARSTASSAVRCSSPKGNISFWAFSSRRWRSFLLTVSSQGILKAIYFSSLTALMRMRT